MLRVVIADDEERICQLIQALGDWQRLGVEVAGIAQNGPDALEMVRKLTPDILITDIRMPGCDGLKVLQEARSFAPELEVIVISGYAQFDYAQTAIRFGVGEYLLKPINRDALNHSLGKMVQRCHERRRQEEDLVTLRLNHDDDRQQLRTRMIPDLLAGRLDADALEHAYHFIATQDAFQIMLLKIDYAKSSFGEPSLAIVRDKIRDVLEPILTSVCADAVLAFDDATAIGVMNYAGVQQDMLRTQLRNALNQLVAEKSLFGAIEFSLALGVRVNAPGDLEASLIGAQNTLDERITEGTGRLLEGEPGKSGILDMDFQARYTEAMAHAMDVMSADEADNAAAVLEEAAAVPGARGWELLALARMAGLMFVNRLCPENSEETLEAYHQSCTMCTGSAELFETLRVFQREQIALAQQRLRDRDAQPIRNAKLYIRKNYAQPITLEEVSAAIGFSVNYFSTLFKKETGEGFAKYLTRVRMDEARTLLRDTSRSVADICKSVGYGDLKHFTHTFKAETGLTPGEYRKLYG